jgi:hypothetical protein
MNVSLDSLFKLAPYCNEYQTHKHFFESENRESKEKFKTSNNAVPSKVIDVRKKNFIFVPRLTTCHLNPR